MMDQEDCFVSISEIISCSVFHFHAGHSLNVLFVPLLRVFLTDSLQSLGHFLVISFTLHLHGIDHLNRGSLCLKSCMANINEFAYQSFVSLIAYINLMQ